MVGSKGIQAIFVGFPPSLSKLSSSSKFGKGFKKHVNMTAKSLNIENPVEFPLTDLLRLIQVLLFCHVVLFVLKNVFLRFEPTLFNVLIQLRGLGKSVKIV